MSAFGKFCWVVAGYVLALLIALAVVTLHGAVSRGPDAQASAGMMAGGDALLFLAIFGVAAIPATIAGLYFLRPVRGFWTTLSGVALVVAFTSLAALIEYLAARHASPGSPLLAWSSLAITRIIAAPLFGLTFLLAALFAPNLPARIILLVTTLIEASIFTSMVLISFHPFSAH
jgi:hypothetical protein